MGVIAQVLQDSLDIFFIEMRFQLLLKFTLFYFFNEFYLILTHCPLLQKPKIYGTQLKGSVQRPTLNMI